MLFSRSEIQLEPVLTLHLLISHLALSSPDKRRMLFGIQDHLGGGSLWHLNAVGERIHISGHDQVKDRGPEPV